MKKFKKNDLRLEKEVISALTETDLGNVMGGVKTYQTCLDCPPVIPNMTITCPSKNITCVDPGTGIGCSVPNCNSDDLQPKTRLDQGCQVNLTTVITPID